MLTLSQTGKISANLKSTFDAIEAVFNDICIEQSMCDPVRESGRISELQDTAMTLAAFNDEMVDLVRGYGF